MSTTLTFGNCSICASTFTYGGDISGLKCGHTFHGECIKKWIQQTKNCPKCRQKNDLTDITKLYVDEIVVDFSDEEVVVIDTGDMECHRQDMGPLGEYDNTEIYRTAEGKRDPLHADKVIPPEGRTILERRLKRATGLICSRTDIAYLEPPERRRRIQQTKERERQNKERERLAKFTNQQKAQQQPTQMTQSLGSKTENACHCCDG